MKCEPLGSANLQGLGTSREKTGDDAGLKTRVLCEVCKLSGGTVRMLAEGGSPLFPPPTPTERLDGSPLSNSNFQTPTFAESEGVS